MAAAKDKRIEELEKRIEQIESALVEVATNGVTYNVQPLGDSALATVWQRADDHSPENSTGLAAVWSRAKEHTPPADDGSPDRTPFE